jgi:hypothetical protein
MTAQVHRYICDPTPIRGRYGFECRAEGCGHTATVVAPAGEPAPYFTPCRCGKIMRPARTS